MPRNIPRFDSKRRELLIRTGALTAASALSFSSREVAAQQSALNALPRIALIIGNTKYAEAPLRNPANDAKAVSGELQKLGFQVTTKLEAGRNEMIEAIGAYTDALAKRRAVGLFYYAGHGAQLAWRNYLIPVDAVIERLEDMQEKTVDLAALLAGISKARNAMNVVILDACRDNPFGSRVQTQQKGLSQFDAPGSSLLAYATSPGNVASDGDGANGLYTENLVRELQAPEAKIEDVFKRVRLNVRRRSSGQQIPWESTSLEEDFYFQPPKNVKKVSEQELERQFNAELAVWEKIKNSKAPGPLEAYLRDNPSGRFAELAQFQLDRVLARMGEKKVEVVNASANPFTKGAARMDTHFRVGDTYAYREIDLHTRLETRKPQFTVHEITESEIRFNNGNLVTDLLGNQVRTPDGRVFSEAQFYVPEYVVGKKWTTRFKVNVPQRGIGHNEVEFRVVTREEITVPAGKFNAFKVEGTGWGTIPDNAGTIRLNPAYWMASGVRRPIAMEDRRSFNRGAVTQTIRNERMELVSYTQAEA